MAYQHQLATTSQALTALGMEHCTTILRETTNLLANIQNAISAIEDAIDGLPAGAFIEQARYVHATVLSTMADLRKFADSLECVVADELWPLPTYQEMLFIK